MIINGVLEVRCPPPMTSVPGRSYNSNNACREPITNPLEKPNEKSQLKE